MPKLAPHWTERSLEDFMFRIGSDFARELQRDMERLEISQAALASKLGVSEGRVSQVLNNPGNLTLKKIVEYARALGRKVSIVAYDDGDPENRDGPVDAEVFATCWANAGKPKDHFALQEASEPQRLHVQLWQRNRTTSTAVYFLGSADPQETEQTSGWFELPLDPQRTGQTWLKQRK